MRAADKRLYEAKSRGRNRAILGPGRACRRLNGRILERQPKKSAGHVSIPS